MGSLVVLHLLSFIADRVILAKIDIQDEIVNQQNVALGAVQGTIYMALGLLLAEMMA